ncbi:hypothetical protein PMAYCL1PPCAC_31340, partial [Pristionchus mayeri]
AGKMLILITGSLILLFVAVVTSQEIVYEPTMVDEMVNVPIVVNQSELVNEPMVVATQEIVYDPMNEVVDEPKLVNDPILVDEPQLVDEPELVDETSDILPDPIGRRFARQAEVSRVWPNGIIPISFSSSYPDKQKASAEAGMKRWEANTCVRFRRNDVTSKDRAVIVNGGSCQSNVGRVGGPQTVILGPACNGISTSAHELGHALGLQHMQTRADRDTYVTLQTGNIKVRTYDLNFKVEATAQNLSVPYDITSIMHYQPYDFARNLQQPTIVPKSMFAEYSKCMGNYEPSFYDYLRVNKMYKCDQKCASYRTQCSNNGVMDVNNCNQCLCPAGWGGKTCLENPSGSTTLTPTASWQQIQTTIGNTQDDQLAEFSYKHLVITAPTGRKVEARIDYMWAGDSAGCKFGGIEIFEKADSRITPPRVCKLSDAKSSYRSPSTRMYIRLYNRFAQLSAHISYRYI